MKLSDYVAEFLAGLSVRDIFLISGGGMMHLLDSVGKHPALRLVCNLNEQASSICADSAGQYTGNLGVCLLTTGPGGTNAMTRRSRFLSGLYPGAGDFRPVQNRRLCQPPRGAVVRCTGSGRDCHGPASDQICRDRHRPGFHPLPPRKSRVPCPPRAQRPGVGRRPAGRTGRAD